MYINIYILKRCTLVFLYLIAFLVVGICTGVFGTGLLSRGICPGDICPEVFVLIPSHINLCFIFKLR